MATPRRWYRSPLVVYSRRAKLSLVIISVALVVMAVTVAIARAGAPAGSCRLSVAVNGTPRPCGAQAQLADTFGTVWRRTVLFSDANLSGRVLTSLGAPSTGVLVQVSQASLDGTGSILLAQTTTNAGGYYRAHVPRSQSRLLTVTAAGESQIIREDVAPNVWLHVTAQRHGVLTLTGRIIAGAVPWPTLVFENWVRSQRAQPGIPAQPAHWQTFAVGQATLPGGWYHVAYQTPPGATGLRFPIRAVTTPTAALIPGASGKHTSPRVRP